MIENKLCPVCVKYLTCEWRNKIVALEGTKKKPIFLDATINGCEQYLLNEDSEEE